MEISQVFLKNGNSNLEKANKKEIPQVFLYPNVKLNLEKANKNEISQVFYIKM